MAKHAIVQVADYSPVYPGNFIASLERLREALRDQEGWDTVLILPHAAASRPWVKALAAQGITVAFLDSRGSRAAKIRAIRRVAAEHHAALLHSHFRRFDTEATLAAWSLRTPSIWHLHSHFPSYSRPPHLRERMFWRIMGGGFVQSIVAVSDFVAEIAIAKGAPRGKMRVIPNGIDLSRVPWTSPDARAAARRRLAVPGDARVLLVFGWEPWTKGVDVLAAALRRLPEQTVAGLVSLVVHGEQNASEIASLLTGIPGARSVAPMEDVATLYAAADFFASASRAEGLPYSMGEAMASGLPIVSSDLAPILATYGRAGPGFLRFRSEDPESLAEQLERVVRMTDDERTRIGASNRSFIEKNYTIERWCADIVDLYGRLVIV